MKNTPRKNQPYPFDISDEKWSFVVPYLVMNRMDGENRRHDLRAVFNVQRWLEAGCIEAMVKDVRMLLREHAGRNAQPSAMILDSRTLQSTPESGARADYDGAKRRKGAKVHAAVDTLCHLLALHVTPANEQDRAQVELLAQAVQSVTSQSVKLAYVDQGYTGETAHQAAHAQGIALEVVKHTEAKLGFVLLPPRWVVERSFAWAARFRRLARDYESARPNPCRIPLSRMRHVSCFIKSSPSSQVHNRL